MYKIRATTTQIDSSRYSCNKIFLEEDTVDQYIHSIIPFINMKPIKNDIQVLLPNKATMKSSHTYNLKISDIPEESTKAHIFKEVASVSLLYIGQLYDVGYTAHFTKEKLYIFFKRQLIMQGTR